MFPELPLDSALQVLLNQQWRNAALDFMLPIFSMRTPLFVILAGLLVWRSALRGKGQAAYFLVLVLAMGLTDLSCNVPKSLIGRVRPLNAVAGTFYQESGQWLRLPEGMTQEKQRGSSFPSAHAANTAALVVVACMFWPRIRRAAWALPLIVGWSRVYVGKHYPLDVAAGWIFGAVLGWLVWQGWKCLAPRIRFAVTPDELYRPFLLTPPDCR